MIAIHGIAAAAEIIIIAIGSQEVINIVVKAFKRYERPVLVPFCRMIEYHVQDNLDSVLMQGFYQLLQFRPLPVILYRRCIAGVGREEADGIIAPVVQKFSSIHYPPVAQLVKFEDGHQLDGIDPQVLQIRDLLSDSLKGSRRADPGIHHGKSPDMHLVDDQFFHWNLGPYFRAPVEIVPHHPGPVSVIADLPSPGTLSGHCLGVRIQKNILLVKEEALLWIIRPIQPVCIFEFLHIQAEYHHGIDISNLIIVWKWNHRIRLGLLPVIEEQLAGSCPLGLHRKADSLRNRGCSVKHIEAWPYIKSIDPVQGFHMLYLHVQGRGGRQ